MAANSPVRHQTARNCETVWLTYCKRHQCAYRDAINDKPEESYLQKNHDYSVPVDWSHPCHCEEIQETACFMASHALALTPNQFIKLR